MGDMVRSLYTRSNHPISRCLGERSCIHLFRTSIPINSYIRTHIINGPKEMWFYDIRNLINLEPNQNYGLYYLMAIFLKMRMK